MENNTLYAIGEALIDFAPDKRDCEFYEVTAFEPHVGGAPANVCGAYSRLGGTSRMLTQLGNDPFGHKILHDLSEFNIDVSHISLTDQANTALAFVSLRADGNRVFSFYRKPSADMLYQPEQIAPDIFQDAYALHFCSVDLGDFPMKEAHRKAIDLARESGALISFDPNLRLQLWDNAQALRDTVHEFIPKADILKISDEELEFITGVNSIDEALPSLFAGDVKLVIYTCGSEGAYGFTKHTKSFSKAGKVHAIDTTGAGDGFIGSFLWKLNQEEISLENIENISSEQLQKCLDFSNKFCAESVQHTGAISSYPTEISE